MVAQTVLSGGANGSYMAINIAWVLAVTLSVPIEVDGAPAEVPMSEGW